MRGPNVLDGPKETHERPGSQCWTKGPKHASTSRDIRYAYIPCEYVLQYIYMCVIGPRSDALPLYEVDPTEGQDMHAERD